MEPLIFVVDDDPFFSRIVSNLLRKNNLVNIEVYKSGEECIEKLNNKPTMIFLDYEMGGLNGIEVLKHVRKTMPQILVTMVSAQEKINIAVNAMKIGAFDYVIKDGHFSSHFEQTISELKNLTLTN